MKPNVMKNESIIPPGCFCYRIKRIQADEILCNDIDRFGKDLREFRYHGEHKEILYPYWNRRDYGTVICEFLDFEVIDDNDPNFREKAIKYLTDSNETKEIGHDCFLSDEVKICNVNVHENGEWIG
jgi:hypothetical protein